MMRWNSNMFHPLRRRNYASLEINSRLQGNMLQLYPRLQKPYSDCTHFWPYSGDSDQKIFWKSENCVLNENYFKMAAQKGTWLWWCDSVPFLLTKKLNITSISTPGAQTLSQIPKGREDNRSQCPTYTRGPALPLGLNIDRSITNNMQPSEKRSSVVTVTVWYLSAELHLPEYFTIN